MFANELMETACRTRQELQNNFHQKDPEWISLYDEFRRLLEKHKIDETSLEQMQFESQELKVIYDKIKELNRKNSALKTKLGNDRKFARIYKTLEPSGLPSNNNLLLNLLERIKSAIDERVSLAQNIMNSEGYFKDFVGEKIIEIWKKPEFCQKLNADIIEKLIEYVSREYLEEYRQAA
jgi:type I restriction enzyme R subunit